VEERVVRHAERPIPFTAWLEICGPDDDSELIDGVLVERPMVQWEHEKCEWWLLALLKIYVRHFKRGVVLHSRCALRINEFRGRLPDIFFVRQDRVSIVHNEATYGAPDFIAEIVSPNDRPSHLAALEADYRNLGVEEIWFIDLPRQRLRMLRKTGGDYVETVVTEGPVSIAAVEGLEIRAEWLLREPRPDELETLLGLLPAADKQG
jgi:Uma2 family endonuclease